MIADNFTELLNALTKHNVEFMLAGGFAVNYHGYSRTTSDLDIWIKPTNDNKQKIYNSLLSIGYPKEALNQILELDFSKPICFQLGTTPIDVDIFNYITGVNYDDAEKNMVPYKVTQDIMVTFISIRDLIVNKMLTGRTQDKLDVEMLQKIQLKRK